MKKFLAFLTALFVAFALVSCGGGDPPPPPPPGDDDVWVLYENGAFTFDADSGIVANKVTDATKPNQVEFTFGADGGTDDCPDVTGYATLTVKFASGVDWGWGPQFQIGGNSTANTSSWADVAEWSGGYDKFNADKSECTVTISGVFVQLKKVMFASGGGTGGNLDYDKILEISVSK